MFPSNPTNGQIYTNPVGTRYRYVSADSKWVLHTFELQGNPGAQGETGVYALGQSDEGDIGASGLGVEFTTTQLKREATVIAGASGAPLYIKSSVIGANTTLIIDYDANEKPSFTGIKWSRGAAPELAGQTGLVDLGNFYYDGKSYYGQVAESMEY